MTYIILFIVLLVLELVYFRVADHYNIIDKPNERSSHSTIVLRGGGIIFAISMMVWIILQMVNGAWGTVNGYLPFIVGLILIAGVSFWDDVRSLPDSVRLVAQFVAMGLMLWSIWAVGMTDHGDRAVDVISVANWITRPVPMILFGIAALIVCVGATNIINFMDGINGITAGYSLAVLIPLVVKNEEFFAGQSGKAERIVNSGIGFIEPSYLMVAILGVLVFCIFNFRPKGKAKCFAGDVGSIGIAFILLFAIGRLIVATGDVTYLILLLVYGVDGCLTICHRIKLHENLGQAHRKHAFQLMANELKMGHITVSLIYMGLQLTVSLGFIFLCPNTVSAHWIYLLGAIVILGIAYVAFMKKYYHLHEEYLASLKG